MYLTKEVYGGPSVHSQPGACYDEQHQVDIRIARIFIFNTYGPRMGANDGRVVSNFIASALTGEDLQNTGDGKATRSFQCITDCTQGLYVLVQSDYSKGSVNIGNLSIAYLPPLVDDSTVRRPDITLAREVLRWGPVIRLEKELRRTVEWHIIERRPD
ncbi:hypothetical protein N7465_006986 [Penicillium sp. CMV-2018d]|nr:hypothetical protein N7465_006986 [Penicillium sp. CMV-2018d]